MADLRAVVLLSGGVDSTTCAAVAGSEGRQVYAVTLDYGQRHRIEIEAARRVARALGVARHASIRIDLSSLGGSALTGDGAVPRNRTLEEIGEGIPPTYVPARNTIFLGIALGWAEVLEAGEIFIGANVVDYSGYPDCRPEYLSAFEEVARLGTRRGIEGETIRIRSPLVDLSKGEILRLGSDLGVDFGLTWSCYDPTPRGEPCRGCDACRLRAKGFVDAGMVDPLVP